MSVIKELIRTEEDGTISFGNYELDTKSKLSDFEHPPADPFLCKRPQNRLRNLR